MTAYGEITAKYGRSKEKMNTVDPVIGIDVSKDSLSICLLNADKKKYFSISNNTKSFDSFFRKISYLNCSKAKFVMESTGIYHLKLATYLAKRNYNVRVLNPIIIKRYSQMPMSRVKTDKTDSFLIAKLNMVQHCWPIW
jgi:transposase